MDRSQPEENLSQYWFNYKTQRFTKSSDGPTKIFVTLTNGTYNFRRKEDAKNLMGIVRFTCKSCEKIHKTVIAKAVKIGEGADLAYELIEVPDPEAHSCVSMPTSDRSDNFMDACYDEVKKDPTKAIPTIYNEVRNALGRDLTETERRRFFQEIPSQRNCQSNLYKYRRNFVPPEPETYVSTWKFIF